MCGDLSLWDVNAICATGTLDDCERRQGPTPEQQSRLLTVGAVAPSSLLTSVKSARLSKQLEKGSVGGAGPQTVRMSLIGTSKAGLFTSRPTYKHIRGACARTR